MQSVRCIESNDQGQTIWFITSSAQPLTNYIEPVMNKPYSQLVRVSGLTTAVSSEEMLVYPDFLLDALSAMLT